MPISESHGKPRAKLGNFYLYLFISRRSFVSARLGWSARPARIFYVFYGGCARGEVLPFMFIFPTRTIDLKILVFFGCYETKLLLKCMDNLESNLQGTDFAALSAANPYSGAADLYRESSWQSFLSNWLGQRTEADAWRENMAIQEREYQAALLQKQHDEVYNDPINQVSRLRKAGLNPDLQTGAVDSGSPGSMGTDMSTPMQSTGAEQSVADFGNFLLTAVTSAFGISKDLFGLGQLRLSNQEKKVGLADKIVSMAFDSVLNGFDASDSKSPESVNQATDLISSTVGNMLPRKFRRNFRQNVSRFWSSLAAQSQEYGMRSKRASDRLDYVRKTGSQYYDPDDEVMKIINEEMISLSDKVSSQSAKNAARSSDVQAEGLELESARQEKESEYLGAVDGSLEGQAQNAQNRLSIQESTMTKEINSTMSNIVHRLSKKADSGDVFAESLLLILNVLRLRSLNVSKGAKGVSFGFSK